MKRTFFLFLSILAAWLPANTFAGYSGSLIDLSNPAPVKEYRFYLVPDIKMDKPTSVNAIAMFETGVTDTISTRFQIGTGWRDFITGGSVKFELFPIADYQAGFALITGGKFIRDEGTNHAIFGLTPVLSTDFSLSFARLEPYAGIDFEVLLSRDTYTFPVNFLAGLAFTPTMLGHFALFIEGNFSVIDSLNYLGIGLVFNVSSSSYNYNQTSGKHGDNNTQTP